MSNTIDKSVKYDLFEKMGSRALFIESVKKQ
jgi:hypothetical protein